MSESIQIVSELSSKIEMFETRIKKLEKGSGGRF